MSNNPTQLIFSPTILMTTCICLSQMAHADSVSQVENKLINEANQANIYNDQQKTLQSAKQDIDIQQSAQSLQQAAAATLIGDEQNINIDASWSVEQIYAYLEKDPEAFENLLLRSIASTDAASLAVLLPAYEKYPQKDQSVIDWGTALIALQSGDTNKSVELFRKINAALPNIRLLRLQMASALYQNKQINAAKNELEKLLREDMPESEREALTSYLESIKRLDKWSYGLNVSFVRDNNLEDAPAVGTTIGNQFSSLTYTTPHESGTGLNYNLSADKKWSYDNKFFTSFSAGLGGTYYWDNKKYNDVYTSVNVGVGYQTASGEIEIAPTLSHSWYGGGISGNDDRLKSYTLSKGVRLSGSKWLSPNVMYQHSTQFTDLSYKAPYKHNDGDIYSMTNGILYAPNAKQYYGIYWNLSKKDGVRDANSYERSGVNLSWNNTWDKGFTTLATFGMASKKYDGINFAGITRHNREYNIGLSIWKRDFSIFKLTPRLNLSAKRVNSNYAFDEFSDANATVVFSKTF
ncbi:MAG: surface lipoprotein assembly modifier [Moraxella sp.]|nr:surface lipoprotein assembly modifier [Moraxella sp.]